MKEYAYKSKPAPNEPKKTNTCKHVYAREQENVSAIQIPEPESEPIKATSHNDCNKRTNKPNGNSEKRNKQNATDESTNFKGSEVICFRSQQRSHFRRGCAQPKKIACYKCKKEGYTTRNCPDCTGNDNKETVGEVPSIPPEIETVMDIPAGISVTQKRMVYDPNGSTDFVGLSISKDVPENKGYFDGSRESPQVEAVGRTKTDSF